MLETILAQVRTRPVGMMLAVHTPEQMIIFVREADFGLRKYPRSCDVEIKLSVFWETGQPCAAALLLRLARNDQATFECWLNPAEPADARLLTDITKQRHLEIHLVTDTQTRVLRAPNRLISAATELLSLVSENGGWSPEEFEAERARIHKLFPTAFALWRNARALRTRGVEALTESDG